MSSVQLFRVDRTQLSDRHPESVAAIVEMLARGMSDTVVGLMGSVMDLMILETYASLREQYGEEKMAAGIVVDSDDMAEHIDKAWELVIPGVADHLNMKVVDVAERLGIRIRQ